MSENNWQRIVQDDEKNGLQIIWYNVDASEIIMIQ